MNIHLEEWQVKNLRTHFGENDKSQTAHWAFKVFDDALRNRQEELKEYSIDIDKQIMIGVKCESEPILIGAVDKGGFVIDLDKIIVKERG